MLPIPGTADAVTIAEAPGRGPGFWAGAPAVAPLPEGGFAIAYRVRNGHDGVDELVIARSPDGEQLHEEARIPGTRIAGGQWLERPAILSTPNSWRVYFGVGHPASKRWWVVALDSPTLAGLADAEPVPTMQRDDEVTVKDPIVVLDGEQWRAWVCIHPLDVPGAEDRMRTDLATSADGFAWDWHGTVLTGRVGEWDERGARMTSLLPDGRALYDGRRNAAENWFERTGVAVPDGGGFRGVGEPIADVRYLTVAPVFGGTRIWYEARLPDETHELRTEFHPS